MDAESGFIWRDDRVIFGEVSGGNGFGTSDSIFIELHNPKFLFPEECPPVGVKTLCEIALNYLWADY